MTGVTPAPAEAVETAVKPECLAGRHEEIEAGVLEEEAHAGAELRRWPLAQDAHSAG